MKPKRQVVPIIGITSHYTPAVTQAGGLPVVLPSALAGKDLQTLFDRLDGILFTGGGDVDPQRFQGRPHSRVNGIDKQRDELEIRLVQMAAGQGKPFLGICRGIQVINVALGGSLYTDIADQLPNPLRHDWFPDIPLNYLAHSVQFTSDSRLAQILGGEIFQVNSLHHQGIERLAPYLRAVARAPDGLVEAVELTGHPFGFGVQWHPEWLPEHQPQRQLFQALVRAAGSERAESAEELR